MPKAEQILFLYYRSHYPGVHDVLTSTVLPGFQLNLKDYSMPNPLFTIRCALPQRQTGLISVLIFAFFVGIRSLLTYGGLVPAVILPSSPETDLESCGLFASLGPRLPSNSSSAPVSKWSKRARRPKQSPGNPAKPQELLAQNKISAKLEEVGLLVLDGLNSCELRPNRFSKPIRSGLREKVHTNFSRVALVCPKFNRIY